MLQLQSEVNEDCVASINLREVAFDITKESKALKPGQVIIEVLASPVNPSDLGNIVLAGTDMSTLADTLKETENTLSWQIDPKYKFMLKGRMGSALAIGNEGCGKVIAAGEKSKHLMGKIVSGGIGKAYSQYAICDAQRVIVHKDNVNIGNAASSFVNPMTVLAFLENLKMDGKTAMVHTAAASNLGQMLQKICTKENVGLVNIVRNQQQEDILRAIDGCKYVVRSDKPDFYEKLVEALVETKATVAFDAIGGGKVAGVILNAMEAAARKYTGFQENNPYGTDIEKTVYIYGGLDRGPTTFSRGFGLNWQMKGWLMPTFLKRVEPKTMMGMFQKIAENIDGIFASSYSAQISLRDAIKSENFLEYAKQATGKKTLILPNKDVKNNKL